MKCYVWKKKITTAEKRNRDKIIYRKTIHISTMGKSNFFIPYVSQIAQSVNNDKTTKAH